MKGRREMTRNSLRCRLWLGAVVPAVAMLAAACSGKIPTSSAPAGSAASAPSGAPVTVGVIYKANNQAGNTPGIQIGANAAAAYVNSQLGGIDGHPVKVAAGHRRNAPGDPPARA